MEIKYCYARDINGKLVNINEALHGVAYYCPQCGNEMIPKKGVINAHHFAHKVECSCNGESYLHKVAKEIFKKIYDQSSEFILEYRTPTNCPYQLNSKSCEFTNNKCYSTDTTTRKLNLKNIFDQCRIEEPINNGQFYADILLRNSSETSGKVLLIEFYHTHKCSIDKLNSGYPIVEIRIDNEKDLIKSNRIVLNDKVSLHGFKTKSSKGNELYIASFNDFHDASDLSIRKLNCIDVFKPNFVDYSKSTNAFVVAIDPLSYYSLSLDSKFKNPPSIGEVACAIAYSKGFRKFENCYICAFSRRSKFNIEELWCTASRDNPELPKNPKNVYALECKQSFPSINRVKSIAKHLKDLKFQILRYK